MTTKIENDYSKLRELMKTYRTGEKVASIALELKQKNARIFLQGLAGSAESLIAAALFQANPDNYLYLLPDKEEAAYFLNDIETLLKHASKHPDIEVLFFPSSYKQPYKYEAVDNTNIQLRAEVLDKLTHQGSHFLIVTYPEALTEKVLTKKVLKKNTFSLKKGESVSIDFITEFLYEYKFERVDFVIEPGQYAVRGGIVDVFSFANSYPFRIEFFGDEVDSLRLFDPLSQFSVKELMEASIIPNILNQQFIEKKESLLQFIDHHTIIYTNAISFTAATLDTNFEKATIAFADMNATIKQSEPAELFVTSKEFFHEILNFRTIEYKHSVLESTATIAFNCSPQLIFNKNFELLTEKFVENKQSGYSNYILSENPKQILRIENVFEATWAKDDQIFTPLPINMHEGFVDHDLKLAFFTDHQIFNRYYHYNLKHGFKKDDAFTLKELQSLRPGDFVVHIDYGIGRFSGLERVEVNGKVQETIRLVFKDNDILNISIYSMHRIAKYSGKEGLQPKLSKLGSSEWSTLKNKAKKKVKEIAIDLIKLYAKRKVTEGFQFLPDTYLQNELEASFYFEDTPDQIKCTQSVKHDMEQIYPMDRLICGDVGFGKTEIAVRAAFKAVADSKQVAILVPTTILALQHYKTFKERLADLPCRVDYVNRFKSAKAIKETLADVALGRVDILIGTHRLVSKDVKFKDLGLLIIDEEQKFGVATKEKLREMRENIDTLTLTATPIPRTLQFSLMGARDISVIKTPPPNRHPVHTELVQFNEEFIRDAVWNEVQRNGQVFFVHNRVQDIKDITGMLQRLCPDLKIATAHGQMDGSKLEDIMLEFIEGNYDVLVTTTIIESGLDISNANTIIINNAQNFGLSDMHQLRGRVGRSNKKAFCYLLIPSPNILTAEARQRLKAIEEFTELGSGFNISMRDLDIRGAGDLLGGEQSGFINEIGYITYQKILDEAITELRQGEYQNLYENSESFNTDISKNNGYITDCQIDSDLEILIPESYISSSTERLTLYKELDSFEKEAQILVFEKHLTDRFGPVPIEVSHLFDLIRLRWIARRIGFEKIVLKNAKLICYFIGNPESDYYQSTIFTKTVAYIQTQSKFRLKESGKKLILAIDGVKNVHEAIAIVSPMGETENSTTI